ncbi:MAG: hypothetical protein KBB70_02225 [Candidatus Pacebacteria bacterium]|nr:hypothetical protein [Candidatus Paceibacterota bacterium]
MKKVISARKRNTEVEGFTYNKNDFPISTEKDYRFYTIGIAISFLLWAGLILNRIL